MAFDVISIDTEIKKKLTKWKGSRSWNQFFRDDILTLFKDVRGEKK